MGIKKEGYRFVDTPLFDGIQSVKPEWQSDSYV